MTVYLPLFRWPRAEGDVITEHERLARVIERETSPTIVLLLRRALRAPFRHGGYYAGQFSNDAGRVYPGVVLVRDLLEAHGIDVDRFRDEKREREAEPGSDIG